MKKFKIVVTVECDVADPEQFLRGAREDSLADGVGVVDEAGNCVNAISSVITDEDGKIVFQISATA